MLPHSSLVLPAVPGGVPRARQAVTDLCERLGLERALADDVRLAVTEACTNCVLHSHVVGEAPHPTFVLDAHLDDDELVVVVRDFGAGLARATASRAGLGLGMKLIAQVCESSEVSSQPEGGTRVAMRFDIPPEKARVPAVVNSLRLGEDELAAVRVLQAGTSHRAWSDPVWNALKESGLVKRKRRDVQVWTLTMRGRLYRTD
jgi:serine/threonine-protein kinase RsbW